MRKKLIGQWSGAISVHLINGIIFLLLFILGLVRYRFGLLIVLNGAVSVIKTFFPLYYPKREINQKRVFQVFLILWIIAIAFDIKNGQLFPKYPELEAWKSLGISVAGFLSSFLLHDRCIKLIQKMTDNTVFVICPNCSFEGIGLVEECPKCKYIKGKPLETVEYCIGTLAEIQQEVDEYREYGLRNDIPNEVVRGIKFFSNESILISINSHNIFKLLNMKKNNMQTSAFWLILTTNRIIYYYGWSLRRLNGWRAIDLVSYDQIKQIRVVPAKKKPDIRKLLIIDTENDSYEILFGVFTKDYFKKERGKKRTNELILSMVLQCIEKRKLDISLPHL